MNFNFLVCFMLFAVGANSQITRLGDACVYPYYVFGSDGDAYASKQREAALVERDEVFLKVLEEMLTALRDNKSPKANVTLEDVAYLKATMDAFQEQNKAQQIQLDVLIRNRMNSSEVQRMELEHLRSWIEQLQHQLSLLQGQNQNINNQTVALQIQIATLMQHNLMIRLNESELDRQKHDIEHLKALVEQLQQQNADLEYRNTAQQIQIGALMQSSIVMKHNKTEDEQPTVADMEQIKAAIRLLQAQNTALKEQNAAQQVQIEALVRNMNRRDQDTSVALHRNASEVENSFEMENANLKAMQKMQQENTEQHAQFQALVEESVRLIKQMANTSTQNKPGECKLNTETGHQSNASGVTYVRWGRTVCPSTSTVIYKGYAAGSHYTHSGGGGEYLCLPDNPQWGTKMEGFQTMGRIYGVEYETQGYSIFSKANNGGRNLQDHEAPCALCHALQKSRQVMIPAWRTCPEGWTMEYRGYLATGHYSHKNSITYACVDEEPEAVASTHANMDGALFYYVEGDCSSLPCPPYANGWELACVVCSK